MMGLMKLIDFLPGQKTNILAVLQAAATVAYSLGVLPPDVYDLIAQVLGWPMIGTLGLKVLRKG